MTMDIKVGDVVHVRLKVTDDDAMWGDCVLFRDEDGNQFTIPRGDIVHVEPRTLAVGDTVTWGLGGIRAEVKAVVGQTAWVKWASSETGGECLKPVHELQRVS